MGRRALVCVWGCLCLFGLALSSDEARARQRDSEGHADRIVVKKSEHTITLMSGETVLFRTKVAIGPGGAGPKLREGDQITPVGRYHVVSKGPSRFHVFLGLDYPNADDRARFARLKAEGALPKNATIGGDVGIHGAPPSWKLGHKAVDWTLGCIAVDDDEIEVIAKKTAVGTIVDVED